MKRVRQYEYEIIADRLFRIVGGSIGRVRDPENHVLIGVGLGKFSMKNGFSSLDSSLLSFFIKKVTITSSTLLISKTHTYVYIYNNN